MSNVHACADGGLTRLQQGRHRGDGGRFTQGDQSGSAEGGHVAGSQRYGEIRFGHGDLDRGGGAGGGFHGSDGTSAAIPGNRAVGV